MGNPKQKLAIIVSATNHYELRSKHVIERLGKEYQTIYVVSDYDHTTKEYYKCEIEEAVQLHVIPYKKNISVSRILSHCMFSYKIYRMLKKYRPDYVYIEIPNNTLAMAGALYKKRHSTFLEMDIFDMWPESFPNKPNNSIIKKAFNIWRWFRNRYIGSADKLVIECDYYRDILSQQGYNIPMETIYLKQEDNGLRPKFISDSESIHLCYLGSINNIIDIPRIGMVIKQLAAEKKVTVHVIGGGESKDKLIEIVKGNNTCVIDHGVIYDKDELQSIFDKCSFGINIYKPDLGIGITMKSITYLRGGLPIINTIDGDTARIIRDYGVGININDIDDYVFQIIGKTEEDVCEMKKVSKQVFKKHFMLD